MGVVSKRWVMLLSLTAALAWVLLSDLPSRLSWEMPQQKQLVDECLNGMPSGVRGALPAFKLLQLRETTGGVVACHTSGDIVCDTVRRHGEFEPNLVQILKKAANTLRNEHRFAVSLLRQRDAKVGACVASEHEGSVLYVDVGGNVGVFALTMMSLGYDTVVFEAMAANHALLTMGQCLTMKLPGPVRGKWQLQNVALGPDAAEGECVICSHDVNVGDGMITCDPETVRLHRAALAAKAPLNSFRSMVRLSSLDSLIFSGANDGKIRGLPAYEPASCITASYPTEARREQDAAPAPHTSPSLPAKASFSTHYYVRRAEPIIVSDSWTTPHLAEYVAYRPVVMKIDVEGFEHMVMRGASRFLTNPATKPTVLVSEVFLQLPDIVNYICDMIQKYDYRMYVVEMRRWVHFSDEARRVAAQSPKPYNVVFVIPGFERIVDTDVPF